MKKEHFDLLEGGFLFLLVLLCLLCPFYAPSTAGGTSLFTLFELAKSEPTGATCLASFVFLPLFFLLGLGKVLFGFLLKGDRENKVAFALYFVWAALGLGYLVFLGKGQSYWAFLVVLLFTSSSIPFSYLRRRLYKPKA